jgi:hypothetical protein
VFRRRFQFLAGIVVLPAYLVAGNFCLIAEMPAAGCTGAGESHQTCVKPPQDSGEAHHSGSHQSEPRESPPPDQRPSGPDRDAPCCDLVANALAPKPSKIDGDREAYSFVTVTSQILEAPVLLDLGVVVFDGQPPPGQYPPLHCSRAPPLA